MASIAPAAPATSTSSTSHCPYIGPSPLTEQSPIFGRDREIEELGFRLVADRIVLLYSPSGAGKSSLIEAGLRPRLRDRFDVLPTARVGGEAPGDGEPVNRYVWSVLQCWAAAGAVPPSPDDTLLSYLWRVREPAGGRSRRMLLIFDQFEEIFTADANDTGDKLAFFTQLGDLLGQGGSHVWALFSMREEFFSWLDPYRDRVPTRLTNTMRIDLLSREQAVQALIGPANAAGVTFDENAARHLARDLAKVRVPGPNQPAYRDGRYVEPVQLQVIGMNLWLACFGDSAPPAGARIRLEDVEHLDAGAALEAYYNATLERTAATAARERVLRDWIEDKLITASNLRSLVMFDSGAKSAPTAEELAMLQRLYLVRAQSRQDAQWFELAHDRLVGPVRASNGRWRERHLPHWKNLVRAWTMANENPALLRNAVPEEIEAALHEPPQQHSDAENRFLSDYRRDAIERKRARRLRQIGYGAALSMVVLTVVALLLAFKLNRQNMLLSVVSTRPAPDVALLAAVEGMDGHSLFRPPGGFDFRRTLVSAMERARHIERYLLRADGRTLTVQANAHYRVLGRLHPGRAEIEVVPLQGGPPVRLSTGMLAAWHPGGVRAFALAGPAMLAIGGQDGSVTLWDLTGAAAPVALTMPDTGTQRGLGGVASLHSDGNRLAAGYDSGRIAVWDLNPSRPPAERVTPIAAIQGHRSRVTDVALFDRGTRLATSGWDSAAYLWQLPESPAQGNARVRPEKPAQALLVPPDAKDWYPGLHSIAVSPDGKLAAAGSRSGRITVWRTSDGGRWPRPLLGHDDAVVRMLFQNDGVLLSAGWDGRVIKWLLDPEGMDVRRSVLVDLPFQIAGLATGPAADLAVVSSEQGELLQLRTATPVHPMARIVVRGHDGAPPLLLALPGSQPATVAASGEGGMMWLPAGHRDAAPRSSDPSATPVQAMDWARVARRLALVDGNGDVYVAGTGGAREPVRMPGLHAGSLVRVALSADGTLLAIRSVDRNASRQLQLWRLPAAPTQAALAEGGAPCAIALPADLRRTSNAVFRPGAAHELAVADDDKVRLWTITLPRSGCIGATVTRKRVFDRLPRGQITSLAFEPQGRALLAGNYLGKVYRIPVEGGRDDAAAGKRTREPAVTVLKHDASGVITALAMPADAPFVVAGDDHGNLFLLASDGRGLLPLPQSVYRDGDRRQPIAFLSLSDDGRRLYSAGTELAAEWNLDPDAWRGTACRIAGGGFTDRQKAALFSGGFIAPAPCESFDTGADAS